MSNVLENLIIEEEDKSQRANKELKFFKREFEKVNVSFVVFDGELIEEFLRAQT